MDREFPSEAEYEAGVRADGSSLPYHSAKLYPPPEPPPPGEDDDPITRQKEWQHYQVDMDHYHTLCQVENFYKKLMQLGANAVDEPVGGRVEPAAGAAGEPTASDVVTDSLGAPPSTGSGQAAPGSTDGVDTSRDEQVVRAPDGETFRIAEHPFTRCMRPPRLPTIRDNQQSKPSPQGLGSGESAPTIDPGPAPVDTSTAEGTVPRRIQRAGDSPLCAPDRLTRAQRIAMGERGAKMLISISQEKAKVAHLLIERSGPLDSRMRFLEDRSVAVVNQLLLYCNAQFRDIGFGAWMPFRYRDQWLSLLTRVLAANGLIHAKHADAYRKLLDETPNVQPEGTLNDRIKETRTPHNIAKCHSNRGASTMSDLQTRLQREVWGPQDDFEKRQEKWWEHLIWPKVNGPP